MKLFVKISRNDSSLPERSDCGGCFLPDGVKRFEGSPGYLSPQQNEVSVDSYFIYSHAIENWI